MIDLKAKKIVILITEILAIFLMVFHVLPYDLSLFLTGLLIFYFIFSPLEDSLWIFIASIPLFVALPVSESFDTMANWRILLALLFLVMFFKLGPFKLIKDYFGKDKLKKFFKSCQLESLAIIFLLIGLISLLAAENPWVGFKKILFLVNALLLYIIIKKIAVRNKELPLKVIGAMKVAFGITLAVGFIQLIITFLVPLFPFWQFWARGVIPAFYGQALSNLLSYSNTWFSYYAALPATLRMFSVFPDSHSFAFFSILALPLLLMVIFLYSKRTKWQKIFFYLFLIASLSAVIFSGSRGAWVSALLSLFLFLIIIFLYWSPTVRSWTKFFIPNSKEGWRRQMTLILGSLIIFFLLFPIVSRILLFSQQVQLDRPLEMTDFSPFERARSIFDFGEVSVKGRLEIWRRTIDSIAARPLLGVGIGNYPVVLGENISSVKKGASAHSLYLDIFSEMGIFGFLIFLVICWLIFKKAWFVFRNKEGLYPDWLVVWAGFFILALFWILGYSLFDVVLFNDKVFLFFLANLSLLFIF